jgi:hypothetical protein
MKTNSKHLLLVLAASSLVFTLSACGETAQCSSEAASSEAPSSSQQASTAHAITLGEHNHVTLYLSSVSAKVGEKVGVTAVVESAYLYQTVISAGDAIVEMKADPVAIDTLVGSFTMVDQDVVVSAATSDIVHKVTQTSFSDKAAVVFVNDDGSIKTDASGNLVDKLDDAKYGQIINIEPIAFKGFPDDKDFGSVKVNGVEAEQTAQNDYGYIYSFTMGQEDVDITVEIVDRTYWVQAESTNKECTLNFGTNEQPKLNGYFKPGDTVSFSVMANAGYGVENVVTEATTDGKTYVEGATTYDLATAKYSFTMPAAYVYISVLTHASNFPIVLPESVSQFSISSITVDGDTLALDDGYKAKAGSTVSFKIYDSSSEKKVGEASVNGLVITGGEPDDYGTVTYTFVMPACEADLAFTTVYDNHAITINGSDHFSASAELVEGTTETAITEAYSGQKVYLKVTETPATDGKTYLMQVPTASYRVAGATADSNLTITLDKTLNQYYFSMPQYAVAVNITEKEAIWKGKSFVGHFYGGTVNNLSSLNYQLELTEDGNIYWDGSSTALTADSVTENADGSSTVVFTRNSTAYTILAKGNEVFVSSGSSKYIYTKAGTGKPASASGLYASDKSAYVFGFVPTGAAAEYAFYDGTNVTFGVSLTLVSGASWDANGARFEVFNGTTFINAYDVGSTSSKYLTVAAVDAVAGTYTLAAGTDQLVLDGYGLGTLAGASGTYKVNSATEVAFTVSLANSDGTVTLTTTVLTLDATAKTYTAGTPASVTLPAFAGHTFTKSGISFYEDGSYSTNAHGVITLTFSSSAQTLSFKISSSSGYYELADSNTNNVDVAYTYDAATSLVSVNMKNGDGTATDFTFTYDATAKTMTMNQKFSSNFLSNGAVLAQA